MDQWLKYSAVYARCTFVENTLHFFGVCPVLFQIRGKFYNKKKNIHFAQLRNHQEKYRLESRSSCTSPTSPVPTTIFLHYINNF